MAAGSGIESGAQEAAALIESEAWLAVISASGTLHYLTEGAPTALQRFEAPAPEVNTGTATHLCLYLPSKGRLCLMDYSPQKRGYTQPRSLPFKEPVLARFSPDGTLLAAGDSQGHLWLIHTRTAKAITLLPKCADAISLIAFSADGSLLAYGSHAKDLHLFDLNEQSLLESSAQSHTLTLGGFLHTRRALILGTRQNEITLYDLQERRSHTIKRRLEGWPTALYLEKSDRYGVVGDKAGALWLLNLSDRPWDLEPIAHFHQPIVSIRAHAGALWVLLQNGTLHPLPLQEPLEEIEKLAREGRAAEAIALAQRYPWLRHSDRYQVLDELFERATREAAANYLKRRSQVAAKSLNPFRAEKRYQSRIQALEIFASKIAAFGEAIEAQRYDRAYALAESHDFYRRLEAYEELDRLFEVKFRAAILMLTGKRPDTVGARKALDEFSRVATKSKLLQHLFEQPRLFQAADHLIKNKRYGEFAALMDRYPILKTTPLFRRYEQAAKEALKVFGALMKAGDRQEALNQAEVIREAYKGYYPQLEKSLATLRIEMAFSKSLQEGNFQSALSYAMRHTLLMSHPAYLSVFDHYAQRFDRAYEHAFKLEFEPMHHLLQPLGKIRYFKARILLIYQCYYLEELRRTAATLSGERLEQALRRFVERFGNPPALGWALAPMKLLDPLRAQLSWTEPGGFWRKPLITSLLGD